MAFPLYGLDASWTGARWLDLFGDQIGDPPRWVALGHETADGHSLIMVNTYSRPPTDAQAARAGQPPLADVAFDAAHTLINVTLPVQSVPRPDGFLPLLTEHAQHAAGRSAQWPTARWRVDAATVAARVWEFAGGWAAVSDPEDDVYLSAGGHGRAAGRPVAHPAPRRRRVPLRPRPAARPGPAVSIQASGRR